jgi:hypothetical protein
VALPDAWLEEGIHRHATQAWVFPSKKRTTLLFEGQLLAKMDCPEAEASRLGVGKL